ncbi:LuxR family transcriptional regulator [Streptomyces sp. A7024]|uniref:LuxR family transcriptional regulator n=1 Tax=Streptomyces coryli TaxID=1128680 RepID=A0A6G4UA33_9ACTN|nr:NB-ARC domain-containing protein [Streptomyces coryli]NGN69034.1 LuxR family transcriptional regulator [Streptomyces coryli]
MVGRTEELARLRVLCPRRPLVTVTGVGGVGKTCLAVHAATALRPEFPDGVWWAGLSALGDGTLVAHAIAEALPLADQSTRPMIEVLGEYLSERRLLLVLDTCEHLADACAFATELLLRAAPGLRILATSRQPLGLLAEEVLQLEPLSVADAHDPGAGQGDAMELLKRRAAEAGSDLADADREELVRLCRQLDGLPLAIELAAVRLREWTPAQLAVALADRFAVLGEPQAVVLDADPPWHQALRTAIGWSHQLCTPAERLLWARLSVFADTFDVEAAREVCADTYLPGERIQRLLADLVDRSIVVWTPTGGGEHYRMLDTLREYGLGWLRRLGEERELRLRHRDYFAGLADRADAAWIGPDQLLWRDRMTGVHADLRAALDFCLAERDAGAAQRLGGALWFHWLACGFTQEGRHYLDRVLALEPASGPVCGKAMWARGVIAAATGDVASLRRLDAALRPTAEQEADESALAAASYLRIAAHTLCGEAAEGIRAAESLPPSLPGGRYPEGWLIAQAALAVCHIHAGHFDLASAAADAVSAEAARRGEVWGRSWGDWARALAAMGLGEAEAAEAYACTALRGKHRLHDSSGMAATVDLLASAAVSSGRGERAARLLGIGQRIWDTLGVPQAGVPELVASRRECEAQARVLIGDEAYETEFRGGRAADTDTGVGYALSTEDTTLHQPSAE